MPTAFYGKPGGRERTKEKVLGPGNLDVTSLSYSSNLFLSSIYPWRDLIGKADEVSGKGLRRVKIVLASGWKSKPCQGSFQTISPLAGHSRELSLREGPLRNAAITTQADRRGSPRGPGSRGRHGLGSTTKLTSWLRNHVYAQIPAPSHPASLVLCGGCGGGVGLTHHHLLWVPTGDLHHPQGRVHFHLGAGHELDDR